LKLEVEVAFTQGTPHQTTNYYTWLYRGYKDDVSWSTSSILSGKSNAGLRDWLCLEDHAIELQLYLNMHDLQLHENMMLYCGKWW